MAVMLTFIAKQSPAKK